MRAGDYRGHLQVVEPDDGVDLVQLPPDDWPEIARDAPGGLRVEAVPNVLRGVIGQRPDHALAL